MGERYNYGRIKKGNRTLAPGRDEVQWIWKYYFEFTYEQVAVRTCGFNGAQRDNYFGGESIRRTEVEVRVRKLKNGKAAGW